jgi:hypothetical protein
VRQVRADRPVDDLVRQGRQPDPGEQVLVAGGSVPEADRGLRRPQGAPDPTRGDDLWVQDSSGPVVLADDASRIVAFRQERWMTPDVPRPGFPSRDKGSSRPPQAPTNCRQIQQFTGNLPVRWAQHLAGGYDPESHKATGKAARLLAAAIYHGHHVELVRVWYGSQARVLEQRLKQRRLPGSLRAGAARSHKPLCPVCNPAGWWRRYPDLPDRPRRPAWHRFRPDPVIWDPRREWDRAFPELADDGPRALTDRGWR